MLEGESQTFHTQLLLREDRGLNVLRGTGKGMGRPWVFLEEAYFADRGVQRGTVLRMGTDPSRWAGRQKTGVVFCLCCPIAV